MPTDSSSYPNKSLHLLGGGVTGVFFHIGVLAALDDHLSHKTKDFDRFVGVSAGSLIATAAAVGITPQEMFESVLKEDRKYFSIRRKDIYRFSLFDWFTEWLKFMWTLFYLVFLKIQYGSEAPSFFWGLKDALPSGIFSMRYYEEWAKQVFEGQGFPRFFSELKKELFIPAFDLDNGKRTVFGGEHFRHVPFYKAIAASSAIPMFFKPVQIEDRFYIDGGLGRMGHLDLSAGPNTGLIIMISPMVPINNDLESVKIKTVFEEKGRIKDKGFTYVYDQSLRTEWKVRVEAAIHHLGYRNPNTDLLLIEPDEDDATMFLFNPMEFESRRQIAEYAYELTRRKLRQNSELWKRTLERHQITLVGV